MRLIIAGSRDIESMFLLNEVMQLSWKHMALDIFEIDVIISGGANGVDKLGEKWAERNNIDVEIYKAQWHKHGKTAGHIRNKKMAENADALIFIWDGKSKGTHSMIQYAMLNNLLVFGLIWKGGILHTDYKINTYQTSKAYFRFLTKKKESLNAL